MMDGLNVQNSEITRINNCIDQFILNKVEFPNPDQVYEKIFGKEANELQKQRIMSQRGLDSNKVCSQAQPIDTLFYKCFQCSDEPTHVICQGCYQPDKHKNHILTYFYSNGGCCDCGDIQVIKPNGFCDKHQSIQIEHTQVDPIKILTVDGYRNTLSFLQIGFAKLFKGIEQLVQYPINQVSVLETLLEEAKNQQKQEIVARITEELATNTLTQKLDNVFYIYDLIFGYIQWAVTDNVRLSKLVAEILMNPIPSQIQHVLPLFHSHSVDYEKCLYINNLPQLCNCSILYNLLKMHVFLDSKHNNEEMICKKAESDILTLFFNFHSHEQFKPFLCDIVIDSLGAGSRMIRESVYEKDDLRVHVMNNHVQYSEVAYEAIQTDINALGFVFKRAHNLIYNSIFYEYLYQFMGTLTTKLCDHKHGCEAIKALTDDYAKLPLWKLSTFHYVVRFEQRILDQLNKESMQYVFKKFISELGEWGTKMTINVLNSNDYKDIIAKDKSILMHFFKFYPTSKYQFVEDILTANQQTNKGYLIFNQHIIVTTFRRTLKLTVNHLQQSYNKNVELNFIRLLIYYHFQNIDCSKVQAYENQDRTVLENYVIADKNFILLLAYYYQIALPVSPIEFKQDLISICGDEKKVNLLMSTVLQRCLGNIILIGNSDYQLYYSGRKNVYNNPNFEEPKQEAIDNSFIQIYIYLYQIEGLMNIMDIVNQLNALYNYEFNVNSLIANLALQDYDMLNTCGFMFKGIIPNELLKAGVKLLKQVYVSQNFLTYAQLKLIMTEVNLDKAVDIKAIVTQICQLEVYSGQLQLKQIYHPPTFEPCLFEGSKFQHQLIEKLEERNEKIVEMFGDALEFELANIDKEYSTLSRMRNSIMEHLRNDKSQTVLKNIISDLQKSIDEQNRESTKYILTSNSGYLNLMFILKQPLDVISELFIQFMKLVENVKQNAIYDNSLTKLCQLYLDKFIGIPKLEIIQTQEQNNNNNNKQQRMIQKFNKLQNKFKDNQNEQNQEIEQNNDKVAQEIYQCSCCLLEIEDLSDGVYLVDAVPTILFDQFIQILDQNNLYGYQAIKDYCKIHVSSCMHVNHKLCIQNIKVSQHLTKLGYSNCPNCFKLFNLQLPIQYNEKTIDEIKATTMDIICNSMLQEYFFGKYAQNDLKHQEMLQEFITQMLISLIQQLLTDAYSFKEKQLYKIINILIQTLRPLLDNNKIDLVNNINSEAFIVKIVKIIQNWILLDKNSDNKEQLTYVLTKLMDKTQVDQTLQCLGFKQLQLCVKEHQPKNNGQLPIKQLFIQHLQKLVETNFELFFLKHHLTKCFKCKFYPTIRQSDEIYKEQYICLICQVKLCSQRCKKNDDQKEGNLQEHSRLQHYGKSIFVGTKTGAIIIQCDKFITKYKQGLFIDKLGQQPDLKADYTKLIEFTLNQKALADISDIILNERYLNYLVSFKATKCTI